MTILRCIIILAMLIAAQAATPDPVIVNINTKKIAQVVDEHFVSLTINPTHLLLGRPFGITTNFTENILRGLSPAYVRLGGPDTNHYVFEADDSGNLNSVQSPEDFIVTGEEWKSVNNLLKNAKLDVIACVSIGNRSEETGKWDSRNALDLISFSDKQNINASWQLGYELFRDERVSGIHAGKDISKLRSMLNAFPRYQSSRLIGPDIRSLHKKGDADYTVHVLLEAGPAMDAVTWHPRWPRAGAIIPTDSSEDGYEFPPDYLEWDKNQLNKILQRTILRKPLWISEPQGENTGSFAEGVLFARRLALAAKCGIEVVMKQPNLNDISHPKTEYWIAAMHKIMLGRSLLESRTLVNQSEVTIVTHCTSPLYPQPQDGGVSIFAVNTGSSHHRTVIRGVASTKHADEKVHQYVLTAGGNQESIFSQRTYLNDEPLLINEDGKLPKFTPKLKRLRQQMLIKLPPYSVGFWVIPQAKVRLCQQEPQTISDILLENPNVVHVINTAQKGINSLRSMNNLIVEKLLGPPEQLKTSSEENASYLGTSTRINREVNIEELGKLVRRQVDEIKEILDSGKLEARQEDRLKSTEDKINGIASDLHNFIGKADQENEFRRFLELSGLTQDFGQLMVADRLARGKRNQSVENASESYDGRQKRDTADHDDNSEETTHDLNRLKFQTPKLDHLKLPQAITNPGMDKISRELQEELILKEIALLEKTEETITDAINSHKKKHDLLDRKLRSELAHIKDEKLATLLQMKYGYLTQTEDSQNNYQATLNKGIEELKDEPGLQNLKKRETPGITAAHKKVHSLEDHILQTESPLEAFKEFLKLRRENQAKWVNDKERTIGNAMVATNIPQTRATPLSESKVLHGLPTRDVPLAKSPLPLVSQLAQKYNNMELPAEKAFRLSERRIPKHSQKFSSINEEDTPNRKARAPYDSGELNDDAKETDSLLAPYDRTKQEGSEEEYSSHSSSVSEEQLQAGSGEESSASGSEESDESGTAAITEISTTLPEGEGSGFRLVKVYESGISKETNNDSSFSEENSVYQESSISPPGEYIQTTPKTFTQAATTFPSSQVTTLRKERTRRNTHLTKSIGGSDATGGSKNDEYGGDINKNAITKRKSSKINIEKISPTPDIVKLASSGVNAVLDDVIPEAYDQSVVKLEHLVLPEYLQNLVDVVKELKLVGNIAKGLGGAAIRSLTDDSQHIQKIERTKRDTREIEDHISEQENKELLQNLDGSHEADDPHHFEQVHEEMAVNAGEVLSTNSVFHEAIDEIAEDLIHSEAKRINVTEEEPIPNDTFETNLTSTLPENIREDQIQTELIEQPTTKAPDNVKTISKSKKNSHKIEFDENEDPSSPWMLSTQSIIQHVIKNLMRKQEELEARNNKGKREIAHSGYPPANFKMETRKPLIPMPQTETINQFMRQLRPGVYVVPSSDMTNVHADQADSMTTPTGNSAQPNVMTLNIYYDKKNQQDASVTKKKNYPERPTQAAISKPSLWPNHSIYKSPQQVQTTLNTVPSTQPLLPPPQTSSLFAPRKYYESKYLTPTKILPPQSPSYSFQPLSSYQSLQPALNQPKYDDSYTLVGHEPRYDGYKLVPVTSFTPWSEGNNNNIDWNTEAANNAEVAESHHARRNRKQEKDEGTVWYMRKTMEEPPIYVKKEIPRTLKTSSSKQVALNDMDKKRSLGPYWNRTIKEIFQETSNEPFWDFLKAPEDSYSSYKSGEDDLNDYLSGEENGNGSEKTSSESESKKLRRKRSIFDNTIQKINAPVKDSFDSSPFDQAWTYSQGDTGPAFYVSGRIMDFKGVPSRSRRDHASLLTNEVYKLKPVQRAPLDSRRITHGLLPKSIFSKSLEDGSFEMDNEEYVLNEHAMPIHPTLLETIKKPEPTPVSNGAPNFIMFSSPKVTSFDESPFKQFYEFILQIFKSMTVSE